MTAMALPTLAAAYKTFIELGMPFSFGTAVTAVLDQDPVWMLHTINLAVFVTAYFFTARLIATPRQVRS